MSSNAVRDAIHSQFAVPVLRHRDAETLIAMSMALAAGGLKVIEITLMSEAADQAIAALGSENGVIIGAGTVTDLKGFARAERAGSRFFVSPGYSGELVRYAREKGHLYVPGALTPGEVMQAMNEGLDLVKIFPAASVGGAKYLKSLSGPFPSMQWMATGGVNLGDVSAYLEAKAFAIGLGGNLTPASVVESKNWAELTRIATQVCAEVTKARQALQASGGSGGQK